MIQNWSTMILPSQMRAARGLLNWSQTELAEAAGLSLPTVKRYETGVGAKVSADAVDKMRHALEQAGVTLLDSGDVATGPGVSLRKDES